MLKPEDAEKVLTKNLANVIRKVHTSKPLTAAERALVAEAAAGGPLLGGSSSAYAKTYHELGQRLGISRKTLENAHKRFPQDCPKPQADGRHDVEAWSQFVIRHNIARTAEGVADAPTEDGQEKPVTVTDWKAKEIELKCEKLTIENAKTAGELVAANDVEAQLSTLMSAIRQALNNLPGRLAQKVLRIADFHEAEEIAQGEVNVVLRVLEACEFLPAIDVDATVVTASPVITAPSQVEKLLPEQKPAKRTKKTAAAKKSSTLPPKGKPRGGKKAR